MGVIQAEGFAVPFDEDGEPYARFGTRIPALRSFYLGWDVGDSTPGDREVSLLQVLPGGESHDLSPSADLQPSSIPEGRLSVALQDAHASGERFFYRVSHSTLRIPGARRYQIRDVGCVDQCVRTLPPEVSLGDIRNPALEPSLIALVGFRMFFTGGADHELDRVGVWFRDNDLHVTMRDRNGDDTFGYLIDFVVIPRIGMNISTGIQRGRASGGQAVNFPTPRQTDFVLTGWALNFVSGDHEIRDLGIDRRGDDFTVIYSDKNSDDPFDWRVEWAHVGPQVFAPAAESAMATSARA